MTRARSFTCDYVLLFATLALIVVGILFIYSSSIDAEGRLTSNEYLKQIIWAVIGFFLMLGVSLIKYNVFYNFAPAIYTAFLLLLLFTLLAGTVVNGARSWLGIGSLGIQPSEFMKIVVILTIVFYLEKSGSKEIASLPGVAERFSIHCTSHHTRFSSTGSGHSSSVHTNRHCHVLYSRSQALVFGLYYLHYPVHRHFHYPSGVGKYYLSGNN